VTEDNINDMYKSAKTVQDGLQAITQGDFAAMFPDQPGQVVDGYHVLSTCDKVKVKISKTLPVQIFVLKLGRTN